jgi:hypothetical protein
MLMLAALLAFAVLDRLTGEWSVMDAAWMRDFAAPMVTGSPLLWFAISLALAAAVAGVAVKALALAVFASHGATCIRVRVMQKLAPGRFAAFLAAQCAAGEDVGYDGGNAAFAVSWESAKRSSREGGGRGARRAPPPPPPLPPPQPRGAAAAAAPRAGRRARLPARAARRARRPGAARDGRVRQGDGLHARRAHRVQPAAGVGARRARAHGG